MSDLFAAAGLEDSAPTPLAARLRPHQLSDVVGQDHIIGKNGALTRMILAGRLPSLILWGPPGVGKTTIARLAATSLDLAFEEASAVLAGVSDLRNVFAKASATRATGRGTVFFVDEIHRFNRAQQDAFLPHMESGAITLIGATTENPSFALNNALLSRAKVFTLKRLSDAAMAQIAQQAEHVLGRSLPLSDAARCALFTMADGDGRALINMIEEIDSADLDAPIDAKKLAELMSRRAPGHDKSGDAHYNLASALQKSIRGSDVDAALYWAARMLEGGEDPRFIFRRLIVIASEDIGNADPAALQMAIAARDAYEFLGRPEGDIALGQITAYLASAPKSNRSYAAFKAAKAYAREYGTRPPPPHAMNAPTDLMKNLGYGAGYIYDHSAEDGFAGLDYFPQDIPRPVFYQPSEAGAEAQIKTRMKYWADRAGRPAPGPVGREKEGNQS